MAILNNIFGGGDQENESSNNSDSSVVSVLDSATDLGVDYETESRDTNEDGETESSYDRGEFNSNLDTNNLLGNRSEESSDSRSESESDNGGGLGGIL